MFGFVFWLFVCLFVCFGDLQSWSVVILPRIKVRGGTRGGGVFGFGVAPQLGIEPGTFWKKSIFFDPARIGNRTRNIFKRPIRVEPYAKMKGRRKVDGRNPFFGKFTGANSGANFAHFPLFFGTKPWYADRTNSYHGTGKSLPKILKAKRCLLWWPLPLRCYHKIRHETLRYWNFLVKRSRYSKFLLGPPYDQILSKVLRRKQPSSESDLYPRK